jgi:hypothetical protein
VLVFFFAVGWLRRASSVCAQRAVGACAMRMRCASTICNMLYRHIECVRVCGHVRVNGILTEESPRPH